MTEIERVAKVAAVVSSDRRYVYAAVIGVLIGGGVLAVWFMRIEPLYGWMAPIMDGANNVAIAVAQKVEETLGNFGTQLSNPATALSAITGGAAVVGGLYTIASKIQSQRKIAQTQVDAAREVAEAQKIAISVGTQLKATEEHLANANKRISELEDTDALAEADKIIAEKNDRIRTLEDSVVTLENAIKELKLTEKVVTH